MATYSIGQLAGELGVTLRTLRFYEGRGIVQPQREGTTRIYSEIDRAKLKHAVEMRRLGFTVREIAAGDLPREQLAAQLELVKSQRAELDEAIAALEQRLAA